VILCKKIIFFPISLLANYLLKIKRRGFKMFLRNNIGSHFSAKNLNLAELSETIVNCPKGSKLRNLRIASPNSEQPPTTNIRPAYTLELGHKSESLRTYTASGTIQGQPPQADSTTSLSTAIAPAVATLSDPQTTPTPQEELSQALYLLYQDMGVFEQNVSDYYQFVMSYDPAVAPDPQNPPLDQILAQYVSTLQGASTNLEQYSAQFEAIQDRNATYEPTWDEVVQNGVIGFFLPPELRGGYVHYDPAADDIRLWDDIGERMLHGEEDIVDYLNEIRDPDSAPIFDLYWDGYSDPRIFATAETKATITMQINDSIAYASEQIASASASSAKAQPLASALMLSVETANNVLTATTQEAFREAVRLDFVAGAELASMLGDNFKWSSHLLKLSLNNNPLEGQPIKTVQILQDGTWRTAMYCDENSELSMDLANTELFRGIFDSFRSRLEGLGDSVTYYEEPIASDALEIGNSSLDWYLAIHNFQLSAFWHQGRRWLDHSRQGHRYVQLRVLELGQR
jgi:hypothetical protein